MFPNVHGYYFTTTMGEDSTVAERRTCNDILLPPAVMALAFTNAFAIESEEAAYVWHVVTPDPSKSQIYRKWKTYAVRSSCILRLDYTRAKGPHSWAIFWELPTGLHLYLNKSKAHSHCNTKGITMGNILTLGVSENSITVNKSLGSRKERIDDNALFSWVILVPLMDPLTSNTNKACLGTGLATVGEKKCTKYPSLVWKGMRYISRNKMLNGW